MARRSADEFARCVNESAPWYVLVLVAGGMLSGVAWPLTVLWGLVATVVFAARCLRRRG
jgi:hypothetical protein